MSLYFTYDPEGDGFRFHGSAEDAKAHAENSLQEERDEAPEGWSENVKDICWGEVKQKVKETLCRPTSPEDGLDDGITHFADYELLDVTPAKPAFYLGQATLHLGQFAPTAKGKDENVDDIYEEDDLS